jgi:hypothetical protein
MTKCEVVAASVLVLWMPAIGVAQKPPAFISIMQDCQQQFAGPRFAAIHDKVSFLSATPPTTALDLKPTSTELAALRALLPLAVDCLLKAHSAEGLQRSTALLSIATHPGVGALALLSSGRITYADYAALFQDLQNERVLLNAKVEAQQAKVEPQQHEQSTLTLSCVVQTAPSREGIGAELQYTVDLVRQIVSTDRGPEPPKNVRITPTEISFNQSDLYTTISRATGRFTTSSPKVGVIVSGTCEPVHAIRF